MRRAAGTLVSQALAVGLLAACGSPDRGDDEGSPLDRGTEALVNCLEEAAADPWEMVGRTGNARAARVVARTVQGWDKPPYVLPAASHYVPVLFYVTASPEQAARVLRVSRAHSELVGSRGAVVFDAGSAPPRPQRREVHRCAQRAAAAMDGAGRR